MSFEATEWAWSQIRERPELAATRRLVLLALADRHNKLTGQCNPSLDLMVADTGMNRHTIPPAIRDLESIPLVIVKRKAGSGSEYTFVGFQTSAENSTGSSAEKRTSAENSTSAEKRTAPVRKSALEPGKNQELRERAHASEGALDGKQPANTNPGGEGPHNGESAEPNPSQTATTALDARFEKFWEAYPRKTSKGTARKAWAKLKPSEQLLGRMISAIERAKTSAQWIKENGQFIPYPASWLNAEGWEDVHEKAPAATNQKPGLPSTRRGDYDQKTKQQQRDDNTDILLRLAGFGEDRSEVVPADGGELWGEVDAIDGEFRVAGRSAGRVD